LCVLCSTKQRKVDDDMQSGADQTNVELVPRKTPRPRARQHPDRRVESLGIVEC
jgi:hypothetical protein